MSLTANVLVLYVGILLINVVLSGVLWFRRRSELHKRLFFVWASSCASFVAQGVALVGSLTIIFGFSAVFLVNLTLAQLVGGVVRLPVPAKSSTIGWIISLLLATGLSGLSSPFWISALPVSIAVAAPLLIAASRALLLRWRVLSTTGKALIVSCYFFCVHNLDFAFLRMREELAPMGFTIALFIVFALSVTAPAAVLERMAEQRVQIENLERLRSRFFSNITHELRTPLTMILAPLEGLLAGEFGGLAPRQKEYLRPIQRNALKLLKLINDFLDLAKIEEQYLRLHVEQTDLVGLLTEVVDQARSLAVRKGIAVELDIRRREGDLQVDIEKMERVLVNLVSNALKFTGPGGRVEIWMDADSDGVRIGVRDTGVGIPEDQLGRVFERFSQADASATRRYGGTGIGLALAKEFVELHGGRLTVTSGEGTGSEFVVHLRRGTDHLKPELLDRRQSTAPSTREKRRAEDREPREWTQLLVERTDFRFLEMDQATERRVATRGKAGPRPTKVLVVEDNTDVLQFLNLQLGEDHDVYSAQDGEQGLMLAIRELPDVIVTDYMMPKMDGLKLIEKLRSDPQAQHIPVIMLTAKSDIAHRIDARAAGADTYLSKPFSPRELRAAVAQLLEKRGRQLSLTVHEQVKSLETISAGLAHEINNPLNYINSALFVISETMAEIDRVVGEPGAMKGELPSVLRASRQRVDRMQQVARKGVQRINRMVSLVRKYAREGYPSGPSPLNVDEALREMAPLLAAGHEHDMHVKLELSAGQSEVSCIPEEMQLAIGNLWQNALDAAGPGGHVTVTSRLEDSFVIVEVSDDGPGIPRVQKERIFVPFYTTKPAGQGLGLGLSIAYRVVNEAGGSLTVDSVEGRGSTFRVRLPVMNSAREAEHQDGAHGGAVRETVA